jgi:hypothetical protein
MFDGQFAEPFPGVESANIEHRTPNFELNVNTN